MRGMSNENRQPRGIPAGGEFATHRREESTVSLGAYATMPVTEIDAELAGYYGEIYALNTKIWTDEDWLRDARKFKENPQAYRRQEWKFRDVDNKILAAEQRIEENRELAQQIRDEKVAPIEDEFDARGGWTRFYLVVSSTGGHVHRNMSCSTCYPRTQYIWLTEESGKSEDEIVERAGDGACTVCYPSAPVADRNNPRPNPFEDPAVKAARAVREAEKAARDAERTAKGITTPSGEPVLSAEGYVLKTERAAEVECLRVLGDMGWYKDHPSDEKWLDTAARIQIALAHKRGVTPEDVSATWVKKLAAKARRDSMNPEQEYRLKQARQRVDARVREMLSGQ